MNLTTKDEEALRSLFRDIRNEAKNPKKNKIENLCDKASLILTKASRRQLKPVRLIFTQEDFQN